MNELDIFSAALELTDPVEQGRLLDEACRESPELRKRIDALLRNAAHASQFLESAAPGLPGTLDQPITERPGTIIGPYKLLQEIGQGGMGVVYMAEQTEPVERRVALKIIKPGMDTRQVIARFEAERQALAMMDHPNIAKVLDAGTTDSGRPYFVMELVKGTPITEYCDEHHLSTRQRLELFVPVCQAVQHAHQKGIIHRDIKPTNVLIAEYDDRAVPKVIDFGIAKAVEHRLTEKTMFTELGQVVGTPEYMSPEQAKLNQLDIDTRSDIYSLGVLLYELLIGETPFDRQRLRSAAFDELLRIIREEEPPRPSIRLSTSETLPSIAANRQIEPKKLGTLVRGELDWIVMKAMEKDRTRRYETANGFAADVQRYLDDERVEACPPSISYRLRKFARRNRAAMATTAIVAASLIAGMIGTGWQAGRAISERDRAIVAEAMAESEAESAKAAEQQTRQESERAKKAESKALTEAARADEEARKAVSAAESERSARVQAQQHLHDAKMQQIADAYDDSQRPRMLELLAESRPLHESPPLEWRYWWRQCHRFFRQIDFRNAERVHLSLDGSIAIVYPTQAEGANEDGHIRQLWDCHTGKLLGQLSSAADPAFAGEIICDIAISEDRNNIAILTQDRGTDGAQRLITWNQASQESRTLIQTKGSSPLGFFDFLGTLAHSPDGQLLAFVPGLASATDSRQQVFVVNVDNGDTINIIRPQEESDVSGALHTVARCAEFSPDGSLLAIGGIDHHGKAFVQLWETATGQLHKLLDPKLPLAVVNAERQSFDTRFASGVYAVHFVHNGTQLLAQAREFVTWDIHSGQEVSRVSEPPRGRVHVSRGLAVSTTTDHRNFTLTHLATKTTSPSILASLDETRPPYGLSADGTHLITVSRDREPSLRFWDVSHDRLASDAVVLQGLPLDGYNLFAYSPDGATLASCSERGTIEIWETGSWKRLRTLDQNYLGPANAVAFSPDGRWLAMGGRDRETGKFRIDVRDLATDGVRQIGTHHNETSSLEFLADGTQLASCDKVGALRVWDCETSRVLLADPIELPVEDFVTRGGNYGGNPHQGDMCLGVGGRLFVSTAESLCRLFDLASGEVQFRLPGADPKQARLPGWSASSPAPLALSPDGRLVAVPYSGEAPVTSVERRIPIRLVNTRTWEVERELAGHGQFVQGLAFSPDGSRLVSTAEKGVIVWSVSTGAPVLRLQSNSTDVSDRGYAYSTVAFSPSGDTLALGGHRELRVIRVATTEEIESGTSRAELVASQERAETLRRREQWAAAIESYTEAIEDNPEDDACWWGRARCYVALGQSDQALADYEEVVSLWKRFGVVPKVCFTLSKELRGRAQALEESKRQQQALDARRLVFELYQRSSSDSDRLLTLAPSILREPDRDTAMYLSIVTRTELAQSYARADQPLEAIHHWCHVLATLSKFEVNSLAKAVATEDRLRGLKNWAKNGVNRLLSLEESGSVKEQEGRFEALDRAMRDGCECPVLLSIRGNWHARSGDIQAALADLARAIELDPNDHTLYASRAELHFKLENYDQAISELNEVIRLDTANIYGRKLRAEAYSAVGRYEEALEDCDSVLSLRPEDPVPALIRAQILVLAGRTAEYRQACQAMLDRFGQSTEPNDFCHAARVCILAPDAVADPNVPVELARRAASENPPQWILYVLGMAYFRAGQLEDAARSFHDSLETYPEWPGSALNWLGLAMVEQARGETEAARQWLTKATTAMEERSAAAVQARLESALLLREIERLLEDSTGTSKENTDTSE